MTTARGIKEFVKEQYPFRIESHAHTHPVSGCSQVSPEELVNLYADLGYHALVVTNHFCLSGRLGDESLSKEEKLAWYVKDYEDAVLAGEKRGLRVLLGAELRFFENANDYLLYGADTKILNDAFDYLQCGLERFRHEGMPKESLLIQAHPFRKGMELMPPELLDGMETLNMHPGHNSAVGLAIRYVKENAISLTTAGSDFHHPNRSHEGLAALRTKELPEDSFALAEILRSGDYVFELGGEAIVLP